MYVNTFGNDGYDDWKLRSDQTSYAMENELEYHYLDCIVNLNSAIRCITVNRDEELFYCGKKTLSFDEAIEKRNKIIDCDFSDIGYKPHYVFVLGLGISRVNFIEMVDHFDIDR